MESRTLKINTWNRRIDQEGRPAQLRIFLQSLPTISTLSAVLVVGRFVGTSSCSRSASRHR
jgi:hypothetical protein